MDAVRFLQERSRMYESGAATPGIGLEDDYNPVIAVKVVEEWAAAHPRKTRQSVFLEQWPEAKIDKDGCLWMCPVGFSAAYRSTNGGCAITNRFCPDCRREFWMQEVE